MVPSDNVGADISRTHKSQDDLTIPMKLILCDLTKEMNNRGVNSAFKNLVLAMLVH